MGAFALYSIQGAIGFQFIYVGKTISCLVLNCFVSLGPKLKHMQKVIEYEISYDIESTVSYLGEENPGEHYFKISRVWLEGMFDTEEHEAFAIMNEKGEIEIEPYEGAYLRDEEAGAIAQLMQELVSK